MLLTTTARKKTLFAGIHVSLRGIAGFTDQRTAFMRVQSAILQGPDFKLRKSLIHEANISKTDPVTLLFLMQKLIQQQERNACAKLKKKLRSGNF